MQLVPFRLSKPFDFLRRIVSVIGTQEHDGLTGGSVGKDSTQIVIARLHELEPDVVGHKGENELQGLVRAEGGDEDQPPELAESGIPGFVKR